MRYATVLSATLALAAAAAVFAPEADAGVVVGVGIPAVAPPAYYPHFPAPAVSIGFGPTWYGRSYWAPAYHSPVYYHPGWGGYYRGGYHRGGFGHGWYHR